MSETHNLLDLTVREIAAQLSALDTETLQSLRDAEAAGKTRKTVIEAIDEELAARVRGEDPVDGPETLAEELAQAETPVELVPLAVAERFILWAQYTGDHCEIRVGDRKFSGTGETREAAYLSAVGAWLASEGKALD